MSLESYGNRITAIKVSHITPLLYVELLMIVLLLQETEAPGLSKNTNASIKVIPL